MTSQALAPPSMFLVPAVALAMTLGAAFAPPARAAVVLSPLSAWASSTNGPHTVDRTHDQSGLSLGYASGSTDFDSYLASGPTHAADGVNAWLSLPPDNTPNLFYDFGVVVKADALALWTEDAFPPALFSAWGSADGVVYVRLASAVAVQTDGLGVDSSAQRVDLTPFHLRHLWLQISCRPNDSACSIGEVALRAEAFPVPEPAPATLLPAALLALVAWRRREGAAA